MWWSQMRKGSEINTAVIIIPWQGTVGWVALTLTSK